MSAKAGRNDDQYMVRFPPGMRDQIKEAAMTNGRSMNSEIISRLEFSFHADADPKSAYREMREAKSLREAQDAMAENNLLLRRVDAILRKLQEKDDSTPRDG